MKGRPDERLVASITIHNAGRMGRREKFKIIWWILKTSCWLGRQKMSTLPRGRFVTRLRWEKKALGHSPIAAGLIPDSEGGL